MLGPRQLALSVEIGNQFLFVEPTPQLALPVEFLFEILCVGAHTPTRIACRISFRNSLCWGP